MPLDALRGVAIALVVLWHYLPQPWYPVHGRVFAVIRDLNAVSWSGVDLFFVLSGFLIGGILLDNRAAANYYRTFYIRRVWRILPLYLVLLAGAALAIGLAGTWKTFGWYLTFQQNAFIAATSSWGLPNLEVTWSLAVEEQFYLLAPLVIRAVAPQRLPRILIAAIVGAPILRALLWWRLTATQATFAAFVLLPCRIDTLAIGVLLAYAAREPRWRDAIDRPGRLGAVAAVAAVLGLLVPMAKHWAWLAEYVSIAGFSFVALFYGVIVWVAAGRSSETTSALVRAVGAVGLGAYSIYLFHLPIRNVLTWTMAPRESAASYAMYGALLCASNALVAVACWNLIERPAIARGHRLHYGPAAG